MKVVCDRAALNEALSISSSVIASRSPTPVLLCLKLVAHDGLLSIMSTDAEVGLSVNVAQVEVNQPGEALVPADKLSQIVKSSEDDTIHLEVKDHVTTVKGTDSCFKIFGYDPKEFPGIREFMEDQFDFQIDSRTLKRVISLTIFATAVENNRFAINGVLVDRNSKQLRLVATDGRRLAMAKGGCDPNSDSDTSCIIPTKALNILNKLMSDPDAMVRVSIDDHHAVFQVGEGADAATLSSNLVEGAFPPFEDVIPKDQDKRVTFDAAELTSAVRRAALLTTQDSKGVRLSFDNDRLTLSSRAPELGEAEIHVDMDSYQGDPIEIGFNPNYITDALRVIDDPQIMVEMKAPNKPGVLKVGNDFTYVVMPVNLA